MKNLLKIIASNQSKLNKICLGSFLDDEEDFLDKLSKSYPFVSSLLENSTSFADFLSKSKVNLEVFFKENGSEIQDIDDALRMYYDKLADEVRKENPDYMESEVNEESDSLFKAKHNVVSKVIERLKKMVNESWGSSQKSKLLTASFESSPITERDPMLALLQNYKPENVNENYRNDSHKLTAAIWSHFPLLSKVLIGARRYLQTVDNLAKCNLVNKETISGFLRENKSDLDDIEESLANHFENLENDKDDFESLESDEDDEIDHADHFEKNRNHDVVVGAVSKTLRMCEDYFKNSGKK